LIYLYLLTVADIQATNENLWNSWKESLLKQLFFLADNYLSQLPTITNRPELKKRAVLQRFQEEPTLLKNINDIWQELGDEYFQKENEDHIYWHTEKLIEHNFPKHGSLVCAQYQANYGATEIFICHKDRDNLFAHCVNLIDQLGLNIVEARIFTSENGFSLNTFSVLDRKDLPIKNNKQLHFIENFIAKELEKKISPMKFQQRRISRQLSHFTQQTKVSFHTLAKKELSELTIYANDRPGLLARIGRAFYDQKVRVHKAKIMTLGDRVEDVFYITDIENNPLKNRQQQIELRKRILFYLNNGTK